jgi:ribose-phosphate pyrophosphokinase
MNKPIVFYLPGNEEIGKDLANLLAADTGEYIIRHFPDGETYVKIVSLIKDRDVLLVCSLNQPDNKLLPLYFISKSLKEFGASKVTLVAPYLAYMRQDKRFSEGECVTSNLFATLISSFVDALITIDPHLHRRSNLNEIYTIPTTVLHAAILISNWIKDNIPNALIVGPDMESEQWVSHVAKDADVPYIVLEKKRHGDRDVEIKAPDVSQWKNHTPVLVDDIISTAKTMMVTANHLNMAGYKPATCIGVHGIFADNAFYELLASGVDKIVTTNSIPHASNRISITNLISEACK